MAMSDVSKRTERFGQFGYRFNLITIMSSAVILAWIAAAVLAPWIAPYPIGDILDFDYFGPMSSKFLLGTDYFGRDVLSRMLFGARITLGVSFAALSVACFCGVALGMAAAVLGGWFDAALSRFLDALTSIPSKILALVIVASVGTSIPAMILTLALIYTPGSYRFARSLAVNINTMDYILVARARGEKLGYLIRSEILPAIIGPLLADFGLRFVFIVLLLSSMSFLGLGIQPPYADLGALVKENIGGLSSAAPAVLFPCVAIASLAISVNLLIDNLPRKIRDRSA